MASAPSVHVVVACHGESPHGLEDLLDDGDRKRLASESEVGRMKFLTGRAALLTAASRFTGSELRRLSIYATCPDCGRSHGRPRIIGAQSPIHVSLTHVEGHAIAVASAVPVGVDAETRTTLRAQRTAVRLVTSVSQSGGIRRGIRHWTRVEAILKADGRGLRIDPRGVIVTGRRGAIRDSPVRYRLGALHPVRGFVVSVAQEIEASGRAGSAV